MRARFGDNVVELEDPYRFPPVLGDLDLYLLGEGTHQQHLRQARRPSDDARGRRRRRLRGAGAERAARQRRRRFQLLGWRAAMPMRVRGNGFWEIFIPHARAGDHYKFEIIGRNGNCCR